MYALKRVGLWTSVRTPLRSLSQGLVACRSVIQRVGVGRCATLGLIEAFVVLHWDILVEVMEVHACHGRKREARRFCKLFVQATAGAGRTLPVHGGDGAIDSG